MYKILRSMTRAALVAALPLVASAAANFNFDTGAAVSSGGDITFNGTSIAPAGSAKLYSMGTTGGSTEFGALSGATLVQLAAAAPFSTTPISGSSLANGEFFLVRTNGGNYAKVLLTAASSSSITLSFVTYSTSGATVASGTGVTLGSGGGAGAPSITQVQNNYSFILPNAPNYGISPGTLVLISGSGMAAPGTTVTSLSDPSKALPQTLNGAQVTVTVGGTTVNPGLYYVIPNYIAAVLPSGLPTGSGTITVSYGGQTSTAFPITLVSNAFGFDYYGGSLAGITDNLANSPRPGHLITTTYSAKLGETVTFWGSGFGADAKNTDVSPPTDFNNIPNGITALYIGNVQVPAANIGYYGRSGYQGVDQMNVTIPSNAPTGCAVSVAAVSGTGANQKVSNIVTMPIGATIGTCSDPIEFVDPTTASTLAGKATVKFGGLTIAQFTSSSGTMDEAAASFWAVGGAYLNGYTSSTLPSEGSCTVIQSSSTTPVNPITLTGLNAGTITVTGPVSPVETLQGFAQEPGIYFAELPAGWVPATGGTFTFAGTAGTDVGAFSNASVNLSSPLTWTNSSSDATVPRSSGVTVNWTGGNSGTFAEITGDSVSSGLFSASFICIAPATAHTFTVPPAVLLQLPAGTGSLGVSNYTNPKSVSIPNLDFAYTMAYVGTSIDATYN